MLTSQGILAGHDFDDTHPGVVEAVIKFAKKKEVTIRVVEGDKPESWYIYKTEPEKLYRYFFDGERQLPNPKFENFT